MTNVEVGERIRHFREQKHMNKNELANLAGVSPTYVYQLEKGEKSPTVEYLGYLCDALGITLCDFFSQNKENDYDRIHALSLEQKQHLNAFLNSLLR